MLDTLLLIAALLPQAPAASDPAPAHPTRLLVKPLRERVPAEIAAAEIAAGARVLRDVPQIGWRVLELAPGRLAQAKASLEASGAFERVDFDNARRVAYTPNDPYWPMWHMQKIKADVAWNTQKGSSSVVVAVMDTGVQTNHPDLAANVWTNPGEIAGNGVDDDQNGYVDDVHGYDFAYGDPDPDDVYGHGTACAGIVAAVQDNGIGVTGVAPRCKVAAIKASIDSGLFYDSANVPALVYCGDMGFEAVSMSFYSDQVTPAERDAIDYAWDHGVLPIAAAGNDASVLPFYPGAYDHVLCVAATDPSDQKSWFSDWGTWVDVAAPGESLSTTATGSGYTTGFGGTSGATPHVAGLAGLLFSAAPGATNAAVRAAIEDTATTLVQPPFGLFSNYGRIDCSAALARILGQTSGSKPARLLWVAPCGGGLMKPASASGPAAIHPPTTFHGLGFELPNTARVLRNGAPIAFSQQTRNEVVAGIKTFASCQLALEINGLTLGTIMWESGLGSLFAPSDASTSGSGSPVLTGGFFELYRADGAKVDCTRNSDGNITVVMPIRGIVPLDSQRMQLEVVRNYIDCTNRTETIELYDWSTASYPYGSFATVSTLNVPSTAAFTTVVPLTSNPARFLDDEGTLYVRLRLNNPGNQGRVLIDQFRLRIY